MSRQRALAPDVAVVLETWQPSAWADADWRVLEPLMGAVRGWVAATSPENVKRTRWLLRCTAGLTVWAYRSLGTSDVRTVLNPNNIEYWTMIVNAHRATTWRENARWALRAVGRAANPGAWPSPSPQVGRSAIASPYGVAEEKGYLRVAKLPGRRNRTERLWIVASALGAGLNGREIAVAQVEDIVEVAVGRLAVRVKGKHSRLTPFRAPHTELVRRALHGTGSGRFIRAGGRNLVYNICARLDPGSGEGLVLRRARSTWLLAHLAAGTSLATLRRVAGPLSANTLDGLLGFIGTTFDETETIREALRA